MLDDHAGRRGEGLDALPRRVGVGDVVVREFLALQLRVARERSGHGIGVAIERRELVRILAVAHLLHLLPLQREPAGERAGAILGVERGEIVRDRAVVRGGVREGLFRQREARRGAELAALVAQFIEDAAVVARIGDHGDARVVLRRAAHHRRPADVDVLDGVFERAARLLDGLAERIEIDHQQIDRRRARPRRSRPCGRRGRGAPAGRRGSSGAASSRGRRASRDSRCSRRPRAPECRRRRAALPCRRWRGSRRRERASSRASSTTPALSETLISAWRTAMSIRA